MADATTAFFEELASRGHVPLLEKATGTMRFDLVDGKKTERWLVSVTKGDVGVSHRNTAADCVVRADRTLFEEVVSGQTNAVAATLRGTFGIEGNLDLLILFQRLFPGPPSSGEHLPTAGYARRQ